MNNNMTGWAIYDNRADDLIAIWSDYESAINFLLDNKTEDDQWEVFPEYELLFPARA